MLEDVAFEGLVVEAKICAFWVEIFLLKIIAVVAIEVANRPDGFDHDLKLACRSFQRATLNENRSVILLDSTQKTERCHHPGAW
jgi:hypothetical protein